MANNKIYDLNEVNRIRHVDKPRIMVGNGPTRVNEDDWDYVVRWRQIGLGGDVERSAGFASLMMASQFANILYQNLPTTSQFHTNTEVKLICKKSGAEFVPNLQGWTHVNPPQNAQNETPPQVEESDEVTNEHPKRRTRRAKSNGD